VSRVTATTHTCKGQAHLPAATSVALPRSPLSICAQLGWAMLRLTDSRPTCTPSSRKEVRSGHSDDELSCLLIGVSPELHFALELQARDAASCACSHGFGGPNICDVDVDVMHAVPHLRPQPTCAGHLR
jgi:hypothetical protein